jgi:site-specific DNA-cytosine methylase
MVRVLEFFSGIGGMRLSLAGALAPLSSNTDRLSGSDIADTEETEGVNRNRGSYDLSLHFTSFDTSDSVNQVYRYNFPGEKLRQVNIESIKASEMDSFAAEVWTMSPPCQPFTTTQNSKRLDVSDMRNKAFMHLMKCLESMSRRPQWIFFENVRNIFIDSYMDTVPILQTA